MINMDWQSIRVYLAHVYMWQTDFPCKCWALVADSTGVHCRHTLSHMVLAWIIVPHALLIKVECHTKFLYKRSLVFLIWSMLSFINNVILVLIDFKWIFLLFIRRKKKKCFSCKLDRTVPYFCYESMQIEIIW